MRAQLLTLDHLVQLMDPTLYLHLQSADSTNFFFFFRMLLVWYKREFEWSDVLRLWESLWTDYLSSNFHLFVALAILEKHRGVIMKHLKHFDEVLKYGMFSVRSSSAVSFILFCSCGGIYPFRSIERLALTSRINTVNELANTIDLPSTLLRAQALFRRFQRTVDAIDKKDNFPAPVLRQRTISAGNTKLTSESNSSSSAARPSPVSRRETTSVAESSSSTSPNSNNNSAAGKAKATESGARENTERPMTVISPELRGLLSRKVIVRKMETASSSEEGKGKSGIIRR